MWHRAPPALKSKKHFIYKTKAQTRVNYRRRVRQGWICCIYRPAFSKENVVTAMEVTPGKQPNSVYLASSEKRPEGLKLRVWCWALHKTKCVKKLQYSHLDLDELLHCFWNSPRGLWGFNSDNLCQEMHSRLSHWLHSAVILKKGKCYSSGRFIFNACSSNAGVMATKARFKDHLANPAEMYGTICMNDKTANPKLVSYGSWGTERWGKQPCHV